jgi:hypothetical protein
MLVSSVLILHFGCLSIFYSLAELSVFDTYLNCFSLTLHLGCLDFTVGEWCQIQTLFSTVLVLQYSQAVSILQLENGVKYRHHSQLSWFYSAVELSGFYIWMMCVFDT